MTSRRAFLTGLAALTLPKPSWADAGNPACLTAGQDGTAFVLHGLTATGDSLFRIALPARGHAATAHPTRPLAVAFARRPGTFALVLDCPTGNVRHQLTPPEGRQFNGHGAFSDDGLRLYTSEVVAETSEGRIGLWDTTIFTRIAEVSSGGIGPHDLKRRPDGSLIIANGGIATDPNDRSKLNLATMRPNLTLLSAEGTLLDRVELPPDLRQNSIRHLALTRSGVAFAMQWEGDAADPVPLLGLWTPGKAPTLCPPEDAQMFAMHGYAGSIAATENRIAITSPRGGVVMLFDAQGKPVATHARADICGIAAVNGRFMASDGAGAVWQVTDAGLTPLARHRTRWDNHLIPLQDAATAT